ncbi:MAG: asparaginase [Peptococcaceae bacterium]
MRIEKLILLATGGTISTIEDKRKGGLIAALAGEKLLKDTGSPTPVDVVNFTTLNSTYLTPRDMFALGQKTQELLSRRDVKGVVISHGTSTMEETAFILDLIISSEKPVVITGAQRPASDPWPDGPQNLHAAFRIADTLEARGKGVLVVFANKIFAAREIQKYHTYHLDAFDSGDKGLVGFVYSGEIKFYAAGRRKTIRLADFRDLPVEIIKFYAGADDKFFVAALHAKVKGIVVEGVGLGNVNQKFYEGIKNVIHNGVEVVMTSRSYLGRVVPYYGYPGGGDSLAKLGVIFAGDYPGTKARLLLMIALNQGLNHEGIVNLFKEYC